MLINRVFQALSKFYKKKATDFVISKCSNSKHQIVLRNCNSILNDLDLIDKNGNKKISTLYNNEITGLFRGVFLISGSVNKPTSPKYHLEIILKDRLFASYLKSLFNEVVGEIKMTQSKKGYVLYLNRSEKIGDFIRILNVNELMFQYENARIQKETINYANRLANCDNANIDKIIKSSIRQTTLLNSIDIKKITFSQKQLDVIKLRKAFPEASYQEMSDKSVKIINYLIPKSTISRVLKDIEKIIENYIKL
jgi:DNA-binding protein WhiA